MKEKFKKMNTMLVTLVMVFSAITASIIFSENVEATIDPKAWPDSFDITTPTNGTYVSAVYNITWENSTGSNTGAGGTNNATWYYIDIAKSGDSIDLNATKLFRINVTNTLAKYNSTGYYQWNTSNLSDGSYTINISAWYNASVSTNASGGCNRTVYIRNSMNGTPGVSQWQGNNYTIAGSNYWGVTTRPLTTSTTGLVVSTSTTNISIRKSSMGWDTLDYYLYYPAYKGMKDTSNYAIEWKQYRRADNSIPSFHGSDASPKLTNIVLNTSGLWVIDNASTVSGGLAHVNFTNISRANNTVPAWFWVNSSKTYTIDLTAADTTFDYNSTGYITYRVENSVGTLVSSCVDIRLDANESSINNRNQMNGGDVYTGFYKNYSYFERAGNYTAYAYYDDDEYGNTQSTRNTYRESNMDNTTRGHSHYNDTYGANDDGQGRASWLNSSASATLTSTIKYNWTWCGPWDPPEYNATNVKMRVTTGTPLVTVVNSTQYYNFSGTVDLNITEPNGCNISKIRACVYNSAGANVTGNLTIDYNNSNTSKFSIYSGGWGKQISDATTYGTNGTWKIYLWSTNPHWYAKTAADTTYDDGGQSDRAWTEEWNTTVYFTVASPTGKVQFTWVDDDGQIDNTTDGNIDGVIKQVPPIGFKQPVTLKFTVQNADHVYLGAGTLARDKKNITISGDALYLEGGAQTLYQLPGGMVWFDGTSTWWVNVTPKMSLNGGEIKVGVNWGTYGAIAAENNKLTIGGTLINGTIVEISPTEFPFDNNVTLSVTVKHPTSGQALTGATVYLYWLKDNGKLASEELASTTTPDTGGGNVYSFNFNKTMQRRQNATAGFSSVMAPRNVTAYVVHSIVGQGYAKAKMTGVADLKVNVTKTAYMAGEQQSSVSFYTTVVDSDGNITGYPAHTDLKCRLYNSTGHDVTGDVGSLSATALDGNDNKTVTNFYLNKSGTYTVHVYNDTHKSGGDNNATIVVTPVDVTSSLAEFIWGVDKNVSAVFTVKYKGELVNGSLRIDNVTNIGGVYNKTWTNTSFKPSAGSGTSGTDNGGNVSSEHTITNGVITISNITANNLSEELNLDGTPGVQQHYSQKEVTFWFKPSATGSAWARTTGVVPVKIADVAASPASVPYNKPAEVELTVTGRGTGLENVWISIEVPGLTGEMNTTTDANGKATFAFTPPTTGNVVIKIENRTSSTKIAVTSWALYLDAPSQADEGEDFTVTVRNGTASGAGLEGAAVTFNKETKTTDSSGQTTFTTSAVTTDREYTILATKEGYAEDTVIITIINVPVLVIVPPAAAPTTGSTFEVIIADDTGTAIIGATVTLNDKTYTSGTQGATTLTAPSEAGEYTITASKTGFQTYSITITVEAGGIPGFELLTLIAAIGVAFILLKRRRR